MATLEAILEGKTVEDLKESVKETEVIEESVEETTEPEETPVEETEEPAGEEEETTTPVVEEKTKEVPLTALLDEREKRQKEQAERERLQKELEGLKTQEPADFFEDPDSAVSQKIQQLVPELVQNQVAGLAIDIYRNVTRQVIGPEKYDPAQAAFAEAAKVNSALIQSAMNAENPGLFIYETGKQMMEFDAAGGDVNAMREQIRAEEKAKILAELKAKEDKLADVPESLTDTPSASSPRDKVEGGPTPLENILPSN